MKDARPLISVLVPSYNMAVYLPELCRSLQNQTHSHFEALILDDGSTDNTREVLRQFLDDSRFRYIASNRNHGLNAAWCELLQNMKGDYWISPGADDRLAPQFLARRLALLEKHPEACLVHGPAVTINENGITIPCPFIFPPLPPYMAADRALTVLLQHNVINQPSTMVRSAITRRVWPLFQMNWKYAPDWYCWILHAASGFGFLWDDQALNDYRIHQGSLSGDPSKAILRNAEIRLVPLCALGAASKLSPVAAQTWQRWRHTLYRLWLARAWKIKRSGQLQTSWFQAACQAYYGRDSHDSHSSSCLSECIKHAPGIMVDFWREQMVRKRQSFRVSGLAQINDPIFT
jgi:glycosyltransferase involved in cell wall biosynthesis